MEINTQLFQKYCDAARELMADLAKISGESYEPNTETELTIQKARAVSSAVMSALSSLRLQPSRAPAMQYLDHKSPVQPQAQAPQPPTQPETTA